MISRNTVQRQIVLGAVRSLPIHPTAEEIYSYIAKIHPTISKGTVYRNLNLLAEEGILIRMPFPVERYDACTEPHSHLRCESCGGVVDLDLPYDAALDAAAAASAPELAVRCHDTVFYGLCAKCREAKR